MPLILTDPICVLPLSLPVHPHVDLIAAISKRFPGDPNITLPVCRRAGTCIHSDRIRQMEFQSQRQVRVDAASDDIEVAVATSAPEDPDTAVTSGRYGGLPVDPMFGTNDDFV